jgi:hypothetical protein
MIRLNRQTTAAIVCSGFILSLAFTSLSSAAVAQIIVAPANQNVIQSGTEVVLKLREELTTNKKKLKVGYRFQMEVAEPILLNGQIVVPFGTPATGEITEIRNKGMWGKSGYIEARAISMRIGGRSIRLTGSFDDKGASGSDLIPVVGFLTPGSSATIAAGSTVRVFLDEDIVITLPPASGTKPAAK